MLEVLFEDKDIIAINKPHGLMVHRSKLSGNTNTFALQQLRDQIDQHVFPIHRLDRKTSGVLLFSKKQELIKPLQQQFESQQVKKVYWAILRGYTEDKGHIDYALTNDNGKQQSAVTDYRTIERTEIPLAFGRFPTSRYSLVEARPRTGRMHQLRKHFAHIDHPIIGDRPHGCNKQNKLFLETWQMQDMLLHARGLKLVHPLSKQELFIQADVSKVFRQILYTLHFNFDPDKG